VEDIYRRLLSFTRDGVHCYRFDDGRVIMANQGFVDLLDLDCRPDDVVGKPLRDLFTYTEQEGMVRHLLEKAGEIHDFEYHFKTLKGDDKWVLHDSFIADDPAQGGRVVQAIVRDITFRKQAEQALRESEEKYRNLVEGARDGICIVREGTLVYANRQLAGMAGYRVEDVVGKAFVNFIAPEEVAKVKAAHAAVLAGARDTVPLETALRRKDGGRADVELSACSATYEGQPAVMAVVRDMTERKQWERAMREAERLEAVKALAGGMAHNFTNFINVIRGYATSIGDNLLPNTNAHEYAERIVDTTNHALHLTKRIMSVAEVAGETAPARIERVSLDAMLSDITDLVGHQFGARNIRFDRRDRGRMPHVKGDPEQLLDAVMSILLNAVDAMPRGGTITIDSVERRIPRPRMNPAAGGGTFVGLRIRDDGVGMSKEAARRAFEPFFTTKQGNTSFGLGLTIAQRTMRAMGGWIDLRSRPGAGCTVRLFLPKAAEPEAAAAPSAAVGGRGEVLLVDDRLELLTMMKEALEKAGFAIHTAGDARSGMGLHRQHGGRIAVTVMDHMLPDDGGKRLLEDILERDPAANVIVTSGFSRDYVRGVLPMGAWGFLQKPFEPQRLIGSVRRMLGEDAEAGDG